MRGRPPKPASLKALSGRSHKGQRPHAAHADALEFVPPPPRDADDLASAQWDALAPLLVDLRVLSESDLPALLACCEAWSDYVTARRVVRECGMTYESDTQTGTIRRPAPEVAIASDAWRRYTSMLCRFGLTPADREKVSRGASDSDDPMLALVGGDRA